MEHPFRSAAFGGFNKQDVLDFLEEQAKQSAQAQQALPDQLAESERQEGALRRESGELRRQLEEVRRELETALRDRDSLRDRLAQAEQELSASQARADGLAQELEEVRRELDQAQTRTQALEPDAQAFAQLKERTAGVELDAHRRAQAIQEKAEGNAQKLRRQTEQWLARLAREYDALRSQVETTISHAASELEKAELCLDQVGQLMASQETALEGLSAAYDRTDPSRVDAPVPLPEE